MWTECKEEILSQKYINFKVQKDLNSSQLIIFLWFCNLKIEMITKADLEILLNQPSKV